MRSCNVAGKCTEGAPFVKDGWCLPREKGEMNPLERLQLLLELQQQAAQATGETMGETA
jgi:hypothetical protein